MSGRITSCVFLKCKNDSYEDILVQDDHEPAVPRIYWCGKTFKAYGPDDAEVGIDQCQPGRQCHCATVSS